MEPSAADWVERDLATVWHPFTQHAGWPGDDPLVITGAEGMYLTEAGGARLLDGVSSLWVSVHGHRVPEIDAAVIAQLQKVAHSTFLGLTHPPGIALAERLAALSGLPRVFYCGDGSSAVEAALKMAYQSAAHRGQHRPLFVHLAESYHGDTLGAVSVGGSPLFHATYAPILLETRTVGSPGQRRPGQTPQERGAEVLDELRALLAAEGERVCAVIVEPLVQAAAGMLTYDPAVLRGIRDACDSAGALLIADEVATGVGRTGTFWAVEQAGVRPDLLTCGKGLTGGYLPLSAVLATEEVFAAFLGAPERTFFHGHTYTANPLACAAALATLDLMEARDTLGAARRLAGRLAEGLAPIAQLPGVREVRQIGTMVGIDVLATGPRTGARVARAARDEGVLLRPLGDVVVLMPPLALPDADADLLLGATRNALERVLTASGPGAPGARP